MNLFYLQFSRTRLGMVEGDAVVPAVGGIYEFAAGMDENLGGGIETFGGFCFLAESRCGGQGFGQTILGVPSEGRYG